MCVCVCVCVCVFVCGRERFQRDQPQTTDATIIHYSTSICKFFGQLVGYTTCSVSEGLASDEVLAVSV